MAVPKKKAKSELAFRRHTEAPAGAQAEATATPNITMIDSQVAADQQSVDPFRSDKTSTLTTSNSRATASQLHDATSEDATKTSNLPAGLSLAIESHTPTVTTSMDPQTDCPIFRLPQELRDLIYTYAFCSKEYKKRIDLHGAEFDVPKVDLILTCRRIHDAAVQLHQASYKAFWSENTFVIPGSRLDLCFEDVIITPKHVQRMTRIHIDLSGFFPDMMTSRKARVVLSSNPGSSKWDKISEKDGRRRTDLWPVVLGYSSRFGLDQNLLEDKYGLLGVVFEAHIGPLHEYLASCLDESDE